MVDKVGLKKEDNNNKEFIKKLIARFESLKAQRSEIEPIRQEIIDLVCPYRGKASEDKKIWDTTATSASDKLASLLHNLITPFGSRWHGLVAPDPQSGSFFASQENKLIREQCDHFVMELFAQRELPASGFNLCLKDFYTEVVLFGMGCFYVSEREGGGLRYISVPVSSIVCSANHENVVDTVFEEFSLTPENVAKKWGYDALSDKMKEDLDRSDPQKYEFFQAVFPDKEDDYEGYKKVIVSIDENRIIEEGYHRVMPYIVGRYEASPSNPFGYSPTHKASPSIRRLNALSASVSLYSEKALNPAVLTSEDTRGKTFSTKPKTVNHGWMDRQGRPRAVPFFTGSDARPSHEEMQRLQMQIRELYLLDLFQVLADRASRSATESMEKTLEKGIFISAIVGGLQAEFVGSMVKREIDILYQDQGDIRGLGKDLKVSYTSPLYKYQKAEELNGIVQGIRVNAEIASMTGDPTPLMMFNPYLCGKYAADGSGVPEVLVLSEEDTKQKLIEKQKQAEASQMKQLTMEESIKTGGAIAQDRAKGEV
ncbi:head-to-tail joining protein [Candidatus Liberibacter asiaticus str. gxpsy]|uniref:Head-to-tail joining protein n=1 Tax=Candidatus Liberibacter asiaticus str. gxpsy TaxID=1174529 RepID=A0ABN4B2D9_LIBAS|nr:portal protein [Candidatus Liberibacter asiaticus]AGH17451.1 head-to-tail joining protein [Candidatus Liberibacter asiaticus str. gxpsy]